MLIIILEDFLNFIKFSLFNLNSILDPFIVFYVVSKYDWELKDFEFFFKILLFFTTILALEFLLISFLIIALFAQSAQDANKSMKVNLLGHPIGKFLVHPIIVGLIRIIFLGLFLLIIATGFWGSQDPLNNLSIVMVWVIAWVGLAFICSLLGNLWALINF